MQNEIIIRRTVAKHTSTFSEALEVAVPYMENLYPGIDFRNVSYIFGPGCRCRYYPEGKLEFEGYPTVYISKQVTWLTYKRKTVGYYSQGIYIGLFNYIVRGLIHELTHHAQAQEGRQFSEVETTQNEIDYVRSHLPKYIKFLTKL